MSFVELGDPLRVGVAEALVDCLVLVANNSEGLSLGQQIYQVLLGAVKVLILIYKDVIVLLKLVAARIGPQISEGKGYQFVDQHTFVEAEPLLQSSLKCLFTWRRWPSGLLVLSTRPRCFKSLQGCAALVNRSEVPVAGQILEEKAFIELEEWSWDPLREIEYVAAMKDGKAEGMQGALGHVLALRKAESVELSFEVGRGDSSECNKENASWILTLFEEPRQAPEECESLPGSWAGNDSER